jgi:hypothetical protein
MAKRGRHEKPETIRKNEVEKELAEDRKPLEELRKKNLSEIKKPDLKLSGLESRFDDFIMRANFVLRGKVQDETWSHDPLRGDIEKLFSFLKKDQTLHYFLMTYYSFSSWFDLLKNCTIPIHTDNAHRKQIDESIQAFCREIISPFNGLRKALREFSTPEDPKHWSNDWQGGDMIEGLSTTKSSFARKRNANPEYNKCFEKYKKGKLWLWRIHRNWLRETDNIDYVRLFGPE